MMSQEEIDAILGEESRASVVVEDPPTEDEDISLDGDVFDIVKDVQTAILYLKKKKMCLDLIEEYRCAKEDSFSARVTAYRIVVAALSGNEERHLTKGDRWYPLVQFCEKGKEKNCWGKDIIGTIESEGKTYSVVGGYAYNGGNAGLGSFYSSYGVSSSYTLFGFRSVSSERLAKHISKYFGRLLFDIHYGGTNCNWRWQS